MIILITVIVLITD